MSNLLKAFHSFVTSDTQLSALVGTRVYRDKITNEIATPFVVYGRENVRHPLNNFSNTHGVRQTNLVVEIVGLQSEQNTLDSVRDLLISKLGGFQGALSTNWKGSVKVNSEGDFFDPDTERSVRRIELNCKEIY